jgi:hypothetical protein
MIYLIQFIFTIFLPLFVLMYFYCSLKWWNSFHRYKYWNNKKHKGISFPQFVWRIQIKKGSSEMLEFILDMVGYSSNK